MEVEFGWVVVGWWVGGVQTHFRVKPNSVEVVLRLSWGCGNYLRKMLVIFLPHPLTFSFSINTRISHKIIYFQFFLQKYVAFNLK